MVVFHAICLHNAHQAAVLHGSVLQLGEYNDKAMGVGTDEALREGCGSRNSTMKEPSKRQKGPAMTGSSNNSEASAISAISWTKVWESALRICSKVESAVLAIFTNRCSMTVFAVFLNPGKLWIRYGPNGSPRRASLQEPRNELYWRMLNLRHILGARHYKQITAT